ncbi:MAG: hypothetical protein U0232_25955 [Thermomicrobiales bacterium]
MTIATARTVTSRDGTTIAYDQVGTGPALILITGALGNRFGEGLVAPLSEHFTVIDYSRRGRGDSGDTLPYAVGARDRRPRRPDRRRRRHRPPLRHLLRCRARPRNRQHTPRQSHQTRPLRAPLHHRRQPPMPLPGDYVPHLNELIAAGRRGDAVEYFLTAAIRLPQEWLAGMKQSPMWPGLEQVAHTIAYDGTIMGDTMSGKPLPTDRWTAATMPTLVMNGTRSEPFFNTTASSLATLLPNARHRPHPRSGPQHRPRRPRPHLIAFFTS